MADRWSTLMRFAGEAPTYRQAFYRWIDHLEKPVNADEYHRGREVFLLWEHDDGRWVVEAGGKKASQIPRRFFDQKDQAVDALDAEGCRFVRSQPLD